MSMSSRLIFVFLAITFVAFTFPERSRAEPAEGKDAAEALRLAAVLRAPNATEDETLKACATLREMGPRAKEAVPFLIHVLDDGVAVRRRALAALSAIGDDAVPALAEALGHRKPYVREAVADTLIGMDAAASLGVPRMVRLLGDSAPVNRARAARLLELSKKDTPEVNEALRGKLTDASREVRHAAAGAIKSLRPPAEGRQALAIVGEADRQERAIAVAAAPGPNPTTKRVGALERLKGDDPDDRIAALHELSRSDDTEFVHRALGHVVLHDPEARVRHEALRMLRARASQSTEGLTAAMGSADDKVRQVALDALTSVKNSQPLRKMMFALMNHLLEDPDPEIHQSAVIWVARFNPRGPASPTALLELLEKGTGDERRLAADALLAREDPAQAVAAGWVRALDDVDPRVRSAAVTALDSLGSAAQSAEPKLIQLVADPANPTARPAAMVLLRLGPDGRSAAVGYLVKALAAGTEQERDQAVRALATVGREAGAAVPALLAMLAEGSNELRIDVAQTLGAIGPEAKAALPALTRVADNRHIDVRSAAVGALAKIDPEGRSLAPALFAAVLNKDRAACGVLTGPMKKTGAPREVFRRLEDMAADDPDDGVRETARVAAEELGAERTTPPNGA
jgi:HEAT repeat protein